MPLKQSLIVFYIDVRVKVLRDGKKGDIINQYVMFTKVYHEQVDLHGRTRKAVLETIRLCKNENVLKEYLESREKEVIDIMITLFDQEYAVERYGDEREAMGEARGEAIGEARGKAIGEARGKAIGEARGKAIGEARGALKHAKETALSMKEKGLSESLIADVLKVSPYTVQQWLTSAPDVSPYQ